LSATAKSTRGAPLLFGRDECINLKRAAAYANRSEKTVRRWVDEFGIGRHAGGPTGRIEVNALALAMLVHGDIPALNRLKSGDRQHPDVRRYADHLGIAV
jgi:hypothetical protein